MNIPSRVNPFGYDNSLPPGYFWVDFLEKTIYSQYIDTGALGMYSYELDYSKISGAFTEYVIGYQAKNTTLIYGCPADDNVAITEMTGGKYARRSTVSAYDRHTLKHAQNMGATCYVDGLAYSTTAYGAHSVGLTEEDISLYLFGAHTADGLYRSNIKARIYSCKAWDVDENLLGNFRPVINQAGVPCVYDSVTGNSYINSGSGQFTVGLTMEQAESFGDLISNNTTLTVSVPWEAKLVQHNSRVEYSLEKARNKGCIIAVQYREPEEDSAVYNKYVDCVTAEDMAAVNPEYKTDLTIEGAWEYPVTSIVNASSLFADSPMKKFSVTLPNTVSNYEDTFLNSGLEGAVELNVYAGDGAMRTYANRTYGVIERKITSAKINFYGGRCYCHSCFHVGWSSAYDTNLESVEILTHFEAPSNMNWDGICDNCRGLKRFSTNIEGKVRYLGNGFNGCQLDKDSVLCVEKMLMTTVTSHQTVLGIHVDWKNDPEVLEAIDKIKTRVTNVYVQWNGTPTVSTFSLRQPPVYAKMDIIEDEDGTPRDRLLWGHYVSDWEAAGCQEFASLEEAYEHFNLEQEIEE